MQYMPNMAHICNTNIRMHADRIGALAVACAALYLPRLTYWPYHADRIGVLALRSIYPDWRIGRIMPPILAYWPYHADRIGRSMRCALSTQIGVLAVLCRPYWRIGRIMLTVLAYMYYATHGP